MKNKLYCYFFLSKTIEEFEMVLTYTKSCIPMFKCTSRKDISCKVSVRTVGRENILQTFILVSTRTLCLNNVGSNEQLNLIITDSLMSVWSRCVLFTSPLNSFNRNIPGPLIPVFRQSIGPNRSKTGIAFRCSLSVLFCGNFFFFHFISVTTNLSTTHLSVVSIKGFLPRVGTS